MDSPTTYDDAPPPFAITELSFNDKTEDSEMSVMCQGKRLVFRLSADQFNGLPQLKEQYLRFLQLDEDEGPQDITVEDFEDWILGPFLPLLGELPAQKGDKASTLEDFLFPETQHYTLRLIDGKMVPSPYPIGANDYHHGYGVQLSDELCARWQCFLPSNLENVPECLEEPQYGTTQKVRPKGTPDVFFVKLAIRGDERRVEKELRNYGNIENAGLADDLRIPRLHDLVRDEAGLVLGMLLTYIDCHGLTLSCAVEPETPASLKRKWAAQVKFIVESLHAAGLVWGDVKAENVLVDINEDAWVIDFEGGYTKNWIAKESAESMAGDLQGLAKILEFLEA